MLTVSCAFDAGNIEVVDQRNPADIQLNIRKDHQSDFSVVFIVFRALPASRCVCVC